MIFGRALDGCPHLAGTTFYSVILPVVLPFWTPKKEAKKVPATSDRAGGPAQGGRPLGTPKGWVRAQSA